jgi:spermidine synthase
VAGESGVGRTRAQGTYLREAHRLLFSEEGPDTTVSVVALASGVRELVIDGFQTSGEAATAHYTGWMGRLPMLSHPHPRRALVICFGTGQTARGVLDEGPESIDVVELSPAVIAAAPLFGLNRGVLTDPRVRTVQMDGRAWLRRTDAVYDVATLEPMAPYFAGTNGLYSVEFYRLLAARMAPGGVVAQWLPLHLLAPEDAAAIARTFHEAFSDARLWIDPQDRTGILLGRVEPAPRAGDRWPGLGRPAPRRDLTPDDVRRALALDPAGLARYAALGGLVTDDNQRLAYGRGRHEVWTRRGVERVHRANLDLVAKVALGEAP